jgi:hypothetical protein
MIRTLWIALAVPVCLIGDYTSWWVGMYFMQEPHGVAGHPSLVCTPHGVTRPAGSRGTRMLQLILLLI